MGVKDELSMIRTILEKNIDKIPQIIKTLDDILSYFVISNIFEKNEIETEEISSLFTLTAQFESVIDNLLSRSSKIYSRVETELTITKKDLLDPEYSKSSKRKSKSYSNLNPETFSELNHRRSRSFDHPPSVSSDASVDQDSISSSSSKRNDKKKKKVSKSRDSKSSRDSQQPPSPGSSRRSPRKEREKMKKDLISMIKEGKAEKSPELKSSPKNKLSSSEKEGMSTPRGIVQTLRQMNSKRTPVDQSSFDPPPPPRRSNRAATDLSSHQALKERSPKVLSSSLRKSVDENDGIHPAPSETPRTFSSTPEDKQKRRSVRRSKSFQASSIPRDNDLYTTQELTRSNREGLSKEEYEKFLKDKRKSLTSVPKADSWRSQVPKTNFPEDERFQSVHKDGYLRVKITPDTFGMVTSLEDSERLPTGRPRGLSVFSEGEWALIRCTLTSTGFYCFLPDTDSWAECFPLSQVQSLKKRPDLGNSYCFQVNILREFERLPFFFQTEGEFELFSWLSAFNKTEIKYDSGSDSDETKDTNLKENTYSSDEASSSDEKSLNKNVVKSGFLMVKEIGFLLPSWKKRFIILDQEGFIKISKTEHIKPEKKNVISIRNCKCVPCSEKGKCMFFVSLTEKHSLSFRASSDSEMNEWILSIQKVCSSLIISGATSAPIFTAPPKSSYVSSILDHDETKLFGVSLDQAMRHPLQKQYSGLEIPFFINQVVSYLENFLDVVGLFRVNGDYESIQKVKKTLDSGEEVKFENLDSAVLCGLLKMFLRELPEPLLTFELYPQIIAASKVEIDVEPKIAYLKQILYGLPELNRKVVLSIFSLLHKISMYSEVNKMGSTNLATVIGPNVLWSPQGIQAVGHVNKIVDFLIENYPEIFDDYGAYEEQIDPENDEQFSDITSPISLTINVDQQHNIQDQSLPTPSTIEPISTTETNTSQTLTSIVIEPPTPDQSFKSNSTSISTSISTLTPTSISTLTPTSISTSTPTSISTSTPTSISTSTPTSISTSTPNLPSTTTSPTNSSSNSTPNLPSTSNEIIDELKKTPTNQLHNNKGDYHQVSKNSSQKFKEKDLNENEELANLEERLEMKKENELKQLQLKKKIEQEKNIDEEEEELPPEPSSEEVVVVEEEKESVIVE